MSLEIKFCPTCNNILNISKNPPKNRQTINITNFETPNTVSSIDNNNLIVDDIDDEMNDDKVIENILNLLSQNIDVPEYELSDFKLEQFSKHKFYQKLDKKTKSIVNAKLSAFFEKLEDSTSAFYHCAICSYSKPIEPGMLIASRIGSSSENTYMNIDKMKNRIYNSVLPYTRKYICTNKNCVSHTDFSKREAVMFRNGNSVQIWYTCCACQSSWKGE